MSFYRLLAVARRGNSDRGLAGTTLEIPDRPAMQAVSRRFGQIDARAATIDALQFDRQFDFEVADGRAVGRQTSRIDKGPADYRLSGRHSAGHSGTIAVPILPIMLLDGEKR
jgi:hypothetical protein